MGVVPSALQWWGLAGTALGALAGLLVLFRLTAYMSTAQVALNIPIAVNEIALAIWLLVRGFASSAAASASAGEPPGTGRNAGTGDGSLTGTGAIQE